MLIDTLTDSSVPTTLDSTQIYNGHGDTKTFEGYNSSVTVYDCPLTQEQILGELGSGVYIPDSTLIPNKKFFHSLFL